MDVDAFQTSFIAFWAYFGPKRWTLEIYTVVYKTQNQFYIILQVFWMNSKNCLALLVEV